MTLDEYIAKAMMLGMEYDPRDHTFNNFQSEGPAIILDADTMETIRQYTFQVRENEIREGRIGPGWLHKMTLSDKERIWRKQLGRSE